MLKYACACVMLGELYIRASDLRENICVLYSVSTIKPTESDEGPRDSLRQMKFCQLLKPPVLWPVGVVVRASNFWLKGRGFDPRPFGFHVATLGKLFAYVCLCYTKQYNLVQVKGRWCPAAGKVTAGLASHSPCVTDFSGLSTCRLTA